MSRPVPLDPARAALRDALLRHTPADAEEADDLKEILLFVEREPTTLLATRGLLLQW